LSGATGSITVTGTWWRHTGPGTEPWAEHPDPFDGRWQRGDVVEGLYLADSPETAWAEWYRYLAEAGMPPERGLPRDLWRWEVDLGGVADLSSEPALLAAGLEPMAPSRPQWPACQRVGERLHDEGFSALIAPAAARPDLGQVLCVFRTAPVLGALTPVPPPERHEHPPPVPRGLRT
jgi:RES domain-containing protein